VPTSSPLMVNSLRVFAHAIEHFISGWKNRKFEEDFLFSLLHLSHAVELAVKAALVKNNRDIYARNNLTVGIHTALEALKNLWYANCSEDVPYRARIRQLIDARNSIQHRYGVVDVASIHYHVETTHSFLKYLLQKEYSYDIDNYLLDTLDFNTLEMYPLYEGGLEFRLRIAAFGEWSKVAPNYKMAGLLCNLLHRAIEDEGIKNGYKMGGGTVMIKISWDKAVEYWKEIFEIIDVKDEEYLNAILDIVKADLGPSSREWPELKEEDYESACNVGALVWLFEHMCEIKEQMNDEMKRRYAFQHKKIDCSDFEFLFTNYYDYGWPERNEYEELRAKGLV